MSCTRASVCRVCVAVSAKESYAGMTARSSSAGSTQSIPVPSAPHSHFWPAPA